MSTTYAVKKGDTFKSLAKKYHGNYTEKKYYDKLIKKYGKTIPKKGTIELPWSTTVAKMTPAKTKPKAQSTSKKVVKKHTKGKAKKTVPKRVKTQCKCDEGVIKNGFIKNMNIIKNRAKNLEHGKLHTVKAIVFHRTVTSKYYKPTKSSGAHFFIAKDGKIYQTASLQYKTYHVGPIYSKCYEKGTCPKADYKKIRHIRTTKREQLRKEGILTYKKNRKGVYTDRPENAEARVEYASKRKFPDRYPINSDSIGLEVVGNWSKKTGWEPITQEQKESITCLTKALMRLYKIPKKYIYTHEKIKRKTPGEGGSYKDSILRNIK